MSKTCHYCGGGGDLRPYGPGGACVCFACAMKPANKRTTERQFEGQLAGAELGTGVAMIGTDPACGLGAGPVPYDGKRH